MVTTVSDLHGKSNPSPLVGLTTSFSEFEESNMGNDGGSIPTRRELVKEGAKSLTTTQVKEVQSEQQAHFWTTCALSHESLVKPVVSDGLGTLYNKAAVLSHLLDLSKQNVSKEEFALQGNSFKDRIRSLKDVVEVHFEESQRTKTENNKWICPITQKVLGPGTKAVYLVPCGHAFAESVVKEMQGDVCLQCNEHYTHESIIPILPLSQSEKDRLEARLRSLKDEGNTHSLKKASTSNKKRKKVGLASVHAEVTESRGPDETPEASSDAIRNTDTATLTSRVLAEQEDKNKRRKANANDNVKSLFSSSSDLLRKKNDFMSRGYSLPTKAKT